MLIALTGATGFVGSYTARTLKQHGHEVRALVRKTSRRDHIEAVVAEFVEGDLDDPQALAALCVGADAVIHSGVDWNALNTSTMHGCQRNLVGSIQLMELARQYEVPQFIFVSSVAALHEISDEWGGRIDELHPTWPGRMYGAYKAAVEAHLKAAWHTYGMNTSSWRPAAVYGVDPKLERSQWYELVRKARDGETISTGQGGKITHVQDVADALTLAVGDAAVAGQIYNLVDGYMYWQRAAEFAREISGSSAVIEDRAGSGPKNQFDCAKAIAFFNRHGNTTALRRGEAGVKAYVQELLGAMG